MKRTLLTPAHATWLAATLDRRLGKTDLQMKVDDGGGTDDPPADGGPGAEDDPPAFPANTPVKDMTAEQQAAYYKHQSARHETRNKDLLALTGGRYGDDLKAVFDELETLRKDKLTDSEKAVEDAKAATRTEVQREFGPKMAKIAFEAALSHIEDDAERTELISALNLTSVLTDDGDVDTAKVRSIVAKIAPADKGTGTRDDADYGAGRRRGEAGTGLSSGRDLYESRRKKSTSK